MIVDGDLYPSFFLLCGVARVLMGVEVMSCCVLMDRPGVGQFNSDQRISIVAWVSQLARFIGLGKSSNYCREISNLSYNTLVLPALI